jgi:hypothetical protein
MIITHSYKWDTPGLQQQQPKLLQLTPIQAAGELYKIKQINDMLMSSFQVKNIIHLSQLCYFITKYLTICFFYKFKGRYNIQLHCTNYCHCSIDKMVLQGM